MPQHNTNMEFACIISLDVDRQRLSTSWHLILNFHMAIATPCSGISSACLTSHAYSKGWKRELDNSAFVTRGPYLTRAFAGHSPEQVHGVPPPRLARDIAGWSAAIGLFRLALPEVD